MTNPSTVFASDAYAAKRRYVCWKPNIGRRVHHEIYGYGTTVYETMHKDLPCVYFDDCGFRMVHTIAQLRPISWAESQAEIARDPRFAPAKPRAVKKRKRAYYCGIPLNPKQMR